MYRKISLKNNCKTKLDLVCGFTMVEMMVCLAIVTILLLVVMYDYRTFNDNLALSSAQQEVSILVRQAQTYGLSVKGNTVSGASDFNSGYGIYVNPSDPTSYYLFVDRNANGQYDGTTNCATSQECIEKDTLRSGVTIKNLCATAFNGSMDCTQNFQSMDVTFIRPNPNAVVRFINSLGSLTGTYQDGRIVLQSSLGKTANVTIENTGQISVQ